MIVLLAWIILPSCTRSDNQDPKPDENGTTQIEKDLTASADFIRLSGKDSTASIIRQTTNYAFNIVYSLKKDLRNQSGTPAIATYSGKNNENIDRVTKNSITGFYTAYLKDADSKTLLKNDKKLFTQEAGNTFSKQFFASDNAYQRIETDQTTEENARSLIKIYMASSEQVTRIISVSNGIDNNKIKIDRVSYLFNP